MPLTPNALEQAARKLLELYAEAENHMISRMRVRLFKGVDAYDWAQKKLAEVAAMRADMQRIVRELEKTAGSARSQILQEGFGMGKTTLAQQMRALGLADRFAAPDTGIERLSLLLADLDLRMDTSHTYILRETDDAYRRIVGESAQLSAAGVETARQATQRALDQFAKRGITGFWDKSGRRWGMAEYAEMAMRTALMRAAIEGYTAQALSYGVDLVIITDHADECPLCRPWENQVLSLTGAERNHPDCAGTMDDARAAGLFHPNCLHSFTAYTPGVTPRTGGDSQTPERSAQGYENRQKQRYMERQVRAWKRRQAAAQAPHNQRVAKAHVDRWQAKLRELVGDADLPRQYAREGGRVLLSDAARKMKPLTLSQSGRILEYGLSDPGWKNAGFQSQRKLARHIRDHLAEFEGFTADDYVRGARKLLSAPVSGDVEGFVGREGFVFKYNRHTNEFALGHPGGTISTYFKPIDKEAYWHDQEKKHRP